MVENPRGDARVGLISSVCSNGLEPPRAVVITYGSGAEAKSLVRDLSSVRCDLAPHSREYVRLLVRVTRSTRADVHAGHTAFVARWVADSQWIHVVTTDFCPRQLPRSFRISILNVQFLAYAGCLWSSREGAQQRAALNERDWLLRREGFDSEGAPRDQYLPIEKRAPELLKPMLRTVGRALTYAGRPRRSRMMIRLASVPSRLESGKDGAIRQLVPLLSSLKAGTYENYEAVWRQYLALCAARNPSVPPLPLGVENVGGFLLWRWLTPKKSGDPYVLHMKATSGIITRLRYFACEKAEDARGGSLRPQARNRLLRLRRALSDMNDAHTNRCYPLTRAMIVDIARCSKVLDPTSEGRADTAMFARLLLCQTAMLRGQDHRQGRLRRKHLKACGPIPTGFTAPPYELRVPPGKGRAVFESAAVPTALPATANWEDRLLDPAFIMRNYLTMFCLTSAPPNTFLFPAVANGLANRKLAASDDGFLRWIRLKLTAAGYGSHVITRTTLHSLRAGGATQAFIDGVPIHVIKRQGRWKSDAVFIYIRLSMRGVHQWLTQALRAKPTVGVRPVRSATAITKLRRLQVECAAADRNAASRHRAAKYVDHASFDHGYSRTEDTDDDPYYN